MLAQMRQYDMRRPRGHAVMRQGARRVVAEMSLLPLNPLTQPRRIGTRPQHPFIVIRLEHQDIDLAAECSYILSGVADVVADARAGARRQSSRKESDGLSRVMRDL